MGPPAPGIHYRAAPGGTAGLYLYRLWCDVSGRGPLGHAAKRGSRGYAPHGTTRACGGYRVARAGQVVLLNGEDVTAAIRTAEVGRQASMVAAIPGVRRALVEKLALLRRVATVGGYTMISRVLGFVRDILIAWALGAGASSDAFFVALKLPNLFRRLFAEGAFSAAFVPLFARELQGEGREAAMSFARQAYAGLLMGAGPVPRGDDARHAGGDLVMAPGFAADRPIFELAVTYAASPSPISCSSRWPRFYGGVLNAIDRFAARPRPRSCSTSS